MPRQAILTKDFPREQRQRFQPDHGAGNGAEGLGISDQVPVGSSVYHTNLRPPRTAKPCFLSGGKRQSEPFSPTQTFPRLLETVSRGLPLVHSTLHAHLLYVPSTVPSRFPWMSSLPQQQHGRPVPPTPNRVASTSLGLSKYSLERCNG